MGEIHDAIERLGHQRARSRSDDPRIVDMAAAMMTTEHETLGVTYSGFALTSLPHKRLPDAQPWERRGHRVRLLIEPGRLPTVNGSYRMQGVPFGAQARLILIYLQSQAIRHGTPEVELGASLKDWMRRMNLSVGGKTYQNVRDQAARLASCFLTFSWSDGRRLAFSSDKIVRSGLLFHNDAAEDPRQPALWSEHVVLSETFYRELRNHAVPLSEEALAQMNNASVAIDIYVWLAYRLHALDGPVAVSWPALHDQFGTGYARLRAFRERFIAALNMVLAVYRDARVEIGAEGVTLHPSHPPIPKRYLRVGR